MSSGLRPEHLLVLSVYLDMLTTTYAVYKLGLPEASPITRLGLQLLGPAYFFIQGLVMLALVKIIERYSAAPQAAYAIPMLQWFAAWVNVGWILRVVMWRS